MSGDKTTIGAIAAIAACVATFAHEAAGHGGACLWLGGQITQLTNVYFQCSIDNPLIPLAGPIGNLVAALAGFFAFVTVTRNAPHTRLLAFLVMAFSLFWFAGYLIYAMALNDGDYIFALSGFYGPPDTLARTLLLVAGLALYVGVARLIGYLARANDYGPGMMQTAWIAATVSAIAATLFYDGTQMPAMQQAFLEIGVASFPLLLVRPGKTLDMLMPRSLEWIAAAALVFLVFAATLGRGI